MPPVKRHLPRLRGGIPAPFARDSVSNISAKMTLSATARPSLIRLRLGPRPGSPSAATGDFKKLLPAGDAEIPDRVESIPFESDADLFDRHVRRGVELNELATARFGSGQDRVSSHEPNAAENAVELHERVESLQRMAYRVYGQTRSLHNELAVQRLADAELCFPLGVDRLRALRDPGGDDGSRGAHQGPQAAAIATMMVESMDSGTGVEEQDIHVRHTWPNYRDGFGARSLSASEKEDRVPGRVAERPELEAATDRGIGREELDHPAPAQRAGPQPVHEDDRRLPAHVGTHERQARRFVTESHLRLGHRAWLRMDLCREGRRGGGGDPEHSQD